MQHVRTSPESRTAYQDSPNESINSNSAPIASAKVVVQGTREIILWLLVGIMIAFWWVSYTEKRVLVMRIEGFERALIAHGIKDTYPHLPGEDK